MYTDLTESKPVLLLFLTLNVNNLHLKLKRNRAISNSTAMLMVIIKAGDTSQPTSSSGSVRGKLSSTEKKVGLTALGRR